MAILHGIRAARFAVKGWFLRSKIIPDPSNPPRVLTNRMYIGLRTIDLFGHMNNAIYLQAFEFSRWQVFHASGFNLKMFGAKIFPVVASVHVNYFRQVMPFQVVTVQTGTLGATSGGRQMICVQHMFDSQKRLCATGIFHISLLSWTTNKPMSVREAFEKIGIDPSQVFMLQQGSELNNAEDPVDISVETLERYKKAAAEFGGLHLTDYFPKTDAHIPMSPTSLEANVVAGAYLSEANAVQRKWQKMGSDVAKNNNSKKTEPEGKSNVKK